MDMTPSPDPSLRQAAIQNPQQRRITGPRPMGSRSTSTQSTGAAADKDMGSGSIRRKPVSSKRSDGEHYQS